MLVNLDFLKSGERFPPSSETDRLTMYSNNRALFESQHSEVYAEDLKRIERVIGNFGDVVSYPVVLNFQKLITLKIADLLLGEQPEIQAKDTKKQVAIDNIIKNSDLYNIAYQVAIDVSRFGDGLFYIRQKDGKGKICITQPALWFPIAQADDIKEIVYHVLAWQTSENELLVRIHYTGGYEERTYEMAQGMILSQKTSETFRTGLDDFAIVQVSNVITSDRNTGLDDYTDVDSIIGELMVRVGQIARVLDKHASPSVSGPASALHKDETTGEWKLVMGSYFKRDSAEDPDVRYITWDGQLAANFTQIEKLTNYLYTISEMGSALFGDMTSSTGTATSGTALRRLMMSPLAKVGRIKNRFDPMLKKAIALCSQLGGNGIVKLTEEDITITWKDGLPNDEKEQAEIMQIRTGGKATISQFSAIKNLDDMNDEAAEVELEMIRQEEMLANPFEQPGIGGNDEPPEGEY